jgi:hypothetical protein
MEDSHENIKYRSCGVAFRSRTSRNEFDYSGANDPWFVGSQWERGAVGGSLGIDEFNCDAFGECTFSFDRHAGQGKHA